MRGGGGVQKVAHITENSYWLAGRSRSALLRLSLHEHTAIQRWGKDTRVFHIFGSSLSQRAPAILAN